MTLEQIDFLIQRAKEHGTYISYKVTEDKVEEPYEINTTWWSAINRADSNEGVAFQVKRYIASRSILLVLKGCLVFILTGYWHCQTTTSW